MSGTGIAVVLCSSSLILLFLKLYIFTFIICEYLLLLLLRCLLVHGHLLATGRTFSLAAMLWRLLPSA